jgi:hypothetical protein
VGIDSGSAGFGLRETKILDGSQPGIVREGLLTEPNYHNLPVSATNVFLISHEEADAYVLSVCIVLRLVQPM